MKTLVKVFYWTPRILCIVAVLFVSMFALDSFAPGLTIWQQIGAFLIHLIPSFALIAILILAWKWELIGGIIFTTIGVITSPLIFRFNYNMNHSVGASLTTIVLITFPFIVVGVLFILSHSKRKELR